MNSKIIDVKITTEYIELQQFLKLTSIIASGGEAKAFIESNHITFNGESEKRRKKKLRNGDVIIVNNKTYRIVG